MTTVQQIYEEMQRIAPLALAESWDNPGLLVDCGDFYLNMNAKGGYEHLLSRFEKFGSLLSKEISDGRIDYVALRQQLPEADIRMKAGKDNIFSRFLKYCGYTFASADMNMTMSAATGMNGALQVNELTAAGVLLDTIRFNVVSDSVNCTYNGQIRNSKNNPQYVFNSLFDGYVFDRGSGLNISIYDAANRLGIKLGATATIEDTGTRLHLLTDDIILGYKRFEANENNYLFLGDDNRVSANLKLKSADGMGLQVYTNDENHDALQDITVGLSNFDLSKITAVLPYFPKITGNMNGDFHAIQTKENITLSSNLSVDKMTYEGCSLGDISTEFVYIPQEDGSHYLDAVP